MCGPCRFEFSRRTVPWFEPSPGPPPEQPEPWSSSRERGPWAQLGPRTADGVVRQRALLLGGRVVPPWLDAEGQRTLEGSTCWT